MIFFIWRKNVLFSRYLDFCVFVKSTDFQTHDVIMCVALHVGSRTCAYFFRIPIVIKMKFGQIQECCITNFSNMFLVLCWGLEGSSNPFYDFIKITIWQDLAIFNNYHFDISLIHLFKKMKHWNLDISGYWVIGAGC